MSLPTTYHGLIKPAEGEMYDLDIFNNNFDAIDLGLVKIDTVNSVADWTNYSFLNSVFTRIRVQNKGIVIAHIAANVDASGVALPINTATGANYGNVVPTGYRPKILQSYFGSIISSNGRGDEVQTAIATNGDWFIRSNTGTALTPTLNSVVHTYCVYEWDGNL